MIGSLTEPKIGLRRWHSFRLRPESSRSPKSHSRGALLRPIRSLTSGETDSDELDRLIRGQKWPITERSQLAERGTGGGRR
jgi:hypothetical protein